MRTGQLWSAAVFLAAVIASGCGRAETPTGIAAAAFRVSSQPLAFTVGPLTLDGITVFTPGPNVHLRDAELHGPVTGDLEGQATMSINANLDGLGNGPAHGTITIATDAGVWQGTFSGYFVGDPAGIQLFSKVVLHGPGQQLLKAECDETSAPSETLACSTGGN